MSWEQLLEIGANLNAALVGIDSKVNLSLSIQTIPLWNGNPKQCEEFLKAVDATQISGTQNSTLIQSAHARTYGIAKSTISNFIRTADTATKTWSNLKKLLKETYGIPTDQSTALEKLRKFKQTSEMSLNVFAQL